MDLIINKKIFKQFRNSIYFVSKDGEVYSSYSKRIINGMIRISNGKQYKYVDVWDYNSNKQKHINIHRMVYIAWNGEIPDNLQVNHINDNSLDNRLENLYVGNQKENINDCIINNHRVGNIFYLTVFDKEYNKILTFCPSSEFIKYCNHPSNNGSINRFFKRNWFKKRFDIIEYGSINNIDELSLLNMCND